MLEVNNFSAIRISLASPDQIREWSKGEVTKPETINYRTLKPEKDGLFDERIFGPTKDWECYCGKYKRIRYKGIICDKCGVEVTRSKVRRERMGHIQLASPVSHIWYFKGTPSRLGILLDISPRNLERILYFALYIVTGVDEEVRKRFAANIEEEAAGRGGESGKRLGDLEAELKLGIEKNREELTAALAETKAELETQRANRTEEIVAAAQGVEARLAELKTGAAEETIVFEPTGEVIVAAGEKGGKAATAKLRSVVGTETERITEEIQQRERDEAVAVEQKVADLRAAMDETLAAEKGQLKEQAQGLKDELRKLRDELESIKPMLTVGETELRTLDEKFNQGGKGRLFTAGMGAEAVRDIISRMDLETLGRALHVEVRTSSGQRRKKAIKRLRLIEAFRRSGTRPEWMILSVLPVIPPDLRPMVQLDGGRFATSDLNDLYRRVINRNNRLKRLLELGAPEIIIRNEKRMLQEACDALIDNGRRGRAIAGTGNHRLKSLSDMLKGKQGRFRQNLLGKRVDYSGRSVIVVGPELKLHQCGLPKKMALELFKPFVMRQLVEKGFAHNIKSAKRIVERVRPEVWDVLEEVINDHPVLLNRAPTLHRLGIQAFMPILVEGSAIQIHPLVCTAFNADFDGDQMAVHVPLSEEAQREAKELMLASNNLLSPADGAPIAYPTKDMVVGMYYLTVVREGVKGEYRPAKYEKNRLIETQQGVFSSFDEVRLALENGAVDLHARIKVQLTELDFTPAFVASEGKEMGDLYDTTVGRVIFNQALPRELRFFNDMVDKGKIKTIIANCFFAMGKERTAEVVDQLKFLGFHYATVSGLTMAISDVAIPKRKAEVLAETDIEVEEIEKQYRRGLITDQEQYDKNVEAWSHAMSQVEEAVKKDLDPNGPVHMMAMSGAAKGGFQQIRQIAGMRGLMADPSGRIIELPIRSNFREGLSVLEYFISTHGARKGLADTALRTADSGYLTRRLIDVAQDVIVRDEDCGTTQGITIRRPDERTVGINLTNRILGRNVSEDVIDPTSGEVIVAMNEEIAEEHVTLIEQLRLPQIRVRSPLTCESRYGICALCYGRSLADAAPVKLGTAVGIIAAQSIGEP